MLELKPVKVGLGRKYNDRKISNFGANEARHFVEQRVEIGAFERDADRVQINTIHVLEKRRPRFYVVQNV